MKRLELRLQAFKRRHPVLALGMVLLDLFVYAAGVVTVLRWALS